ncbi:MAG: CBS domain-containing protein, partial [Cyanothece sp. SIO2G6]|nr:CBS domain-containing protein [Cyanothece sp. SIO2G6]
MTMLAFLKSAVIPNPVTVSPETTVAEALKQLSTLEHRAATDPQNSWSVQIRASCIVVLDRRRVVGMVTDQEIKALQLGQWHDANPQVVRFPPTSPLDLNHLSIDDVMVSPITTLRSWDCLNLASLMDLFIQPGIHYLPIVNSQAQFLGIISRESLGYAALQQMIDPASGPGKSPDASHGPDTSHVCPSMIPAHSSFLGDLAAAPGDLAAAPGDLTVAKPTHTWSLKQEFAVRITEREAQANWAKVLTDLTAQICSSLDIRTILDITVEQVQQVLGCDRLTIWQFDPDGSAIAVAEAMGHSSASLLGQRIDTASLSLQQHELDPVDPVDPMDPQTY